MMLFLCQRECVRQEEVKEAITHMVPVGMPVTDKRREARKDCHAVFD